MISLCLPMFSYAAEDPTRPLDWSQPEPQAEPTNRRLPVLNSIICMSQCSAVIHDQVVTKGDVVDGYTVQEINQTGVTIQRDAQEWQLKLYSLQIKH
ncbi:MAG: MSHA biogenesis protein MshK [Vibrio sp.]